MDDRRTAPTPDAEPADHRPKAPPLILGLQIAAVTILVGWALHATAAVSALIVAALFTAIVMAPLDRRVAAGLPERWRWVGHLVAFLVLLLVVVAFAGGLLFSAQRIATAFPGLEDTPASAFVDMGEDEGSRERDSGTDGGGDVAEGEGEQGRASEDGGAMGSLRDALEEVDLAGSDIAAQAGEFVSRAAMGLLRFAAAALSGVALAIFLALIMLVGAPGWRARTERVWGTARAEQVGHVVGVIGHQIRRFLMVRAVIGVVTGVLYMLWLWLFGVDLILVWGVLTVLLTFVPNLGSIISGILPTIYVFLTQDLGTALAIGAGLTVIEQVTGNFIDPRLQGRYVSIAPSVILAGLLIWTWIWGVPGALLATPMLITAVIVGAHIDSLRPMALLMSDCRSYEELDKITGRA